MPLPQTEILFLPPHFSVDFPVQPMLHVLSLSRMALAPVAKPHCAWLGLASSFVGSRVSTHEALPSKFQTGETETTLGAKD